ncbi:twin-arginine translocase subunit TatC [Thermosynechococcus sp. QKsg1]|uniref:twin-arginine translocase subunit TatC n=1 Tax=unclassified Thermosynechococcus TaxID=2622553 RepID=UPI00122DCABD|nr:MULTISPECIES: twin-arginine translocase subunit TatC [unclassified Thermosynechococcus]MDR7921799.1 twin-arginine translocase subunit TatC [Thermosynechococcus sp. HY213]MDR7993839.1 twin-arginine translocase subunit TatC [Thermosynechococcus sp. TG252]QEQ00145.1 twin-arginine translocase subunit TatC [Thermosynechococcus sp. CL-1]WJI24348.1 twin-arginine translocase subunit TatC [Thermosynechococcus sp. B0]WJI26868.1 twin-arginine translocase subunit TatC [Thermosynechococcus sp. B1]
MTRSPDIDSPAPESSAIVDSTLEASDPIDPEDELPNEVEMSLWDHLEELRQRLFVVLGTVAVTIVLCFTQVRWIIQFLEKPAHGAKFLQLSPGEYFFVSCKAAAYSGILLATPMILYQAIRFILPGLTRREQRLLAPVVFGSSILFIAGLAFAYTLLAPAALGFFINYGADVVEQLWSIDRYVDFILLLLLATGLAFQVPILQLVLIALGIVSIPQMLSQWRYVVIIAVAVAAVLTPSIDPITQGLLAGALLALYFTGIGLAKLMGVGRSEA